MSPISTTEVNELESKTKELDLNNATSKQDSAKADGLNTSGAADDAEDDEDQDESAANGTTSSSSDKKKKKKKNNKKKKKLVAIDQSYPDGVFPGRGMDGIPIRFQQASHNIRRIEVFR